MGKQSKEMVGPLQPEAWLAVIHRFQFLTLEASQALGLVGLQRPPKPWSHFCLMGSLFSCFNKGYRPESSWSRLWGLGYMPPKGLARRKAFLPPVHAYKTYGDRESRTLLFQIHSEMKNGNKRIKRSKYEEQDDPYFI